MDEEGMVGSFRSVRVRLDTDESSKRAEASAWPMNPAAPVMIIFIAHQRRPSGNRFDTRLLERVQSASS